LQGSFKKIEMVSGADDDWSDSDDMQSEVETRVLLGIPDGVIDSPEDLADAALSRIGGRPVRYYVCLGASNTILTFPEGIFTCN
jgi:hypothetical protein